LRVSHSAMGPFSLPMDQTKWRFHIDGQVLRPKDLPRFVWNKRMVPQKKGHYVASIGAVKMTTAGQTGSDQYCELGVGIEVAEDYYLKLFPASFIRKVDEAGKEHFNLRIDAYSKRDDMLKNGWKHLETLEEMNEVADIKNQPAGVRELLIREVYTIGEEVQTR
ncbi:hypothetical protein MYX75_10845, partial [Acidobacteria bacterium AH-259-A15]|nr:hypothetical protein [Acidobacteria bacterium AH-259-A15]